ncbi:transcriptional regulator [Paraburkholderia sp. SUR17]|jgi:hypothetical protein|uniref:transcriptional regulator n=1 Tax=Paraburkholderia sp. SUR17 TaxID=3034358 RepID=UPI002407EEB4|nr:transcriptional regulator [Paraburkholderia sp. SUR17]WEY40889.1 transcriptional regulator [Paraburkholderia sp. SUR17]
MNRAIQYKGYAVTPVAQRLPNGLFAAGLTIERVAIERVATETAAANESDARSFDALDYFFDEEHALAYASRWGRLWIDNRKRGQ